MNETEELSGAPHTIGQTKDGSFQIGARRTLPIPLERAWQLLTSPNGVRRWLGDTTGLSLRPGASYTLAAGGGGEVRVMRPNDHLRITWQPAGWARASTIQVRVIPRGAGTTIAFHQEQLPDSEERERRRAHFEAVLMELSQLAH
jgi:uncharacterized protein YndB with AHSA1/START domain